MKQILVPTDFSQPASYAADTAIKLAQGFAAEVHFYTRVNVHPLWDEMSEKSRLDFPESFARLFETKENFQKLRDNYKDSGVRITTAYSHGDLLGNIQKYIEDENIDFIVMGSDGADGWKEFVVGSNTQKLIRYAPCPVLVIKHPEPYHFNTIVFVSDFGESAREPFEQLLTFARHLGDPEIHLLTVGQYPRFEMPAPVQRGAMEEFAAVAEEQGISCTIAKVEDVDRELGVKHYSIDHHVDLVALANYGKSAIKRLFTGSMTEALINHLEIPVFTLNTPGTNKNKRTPHFFSEKNEG